MVEISFNNETNVEMNEWIDLANLIINSTIKHLNINLKVTMSLNFINKKEALKLNQIYRHEQYVPDVISFPSGIDFLVAEQIKIYEIGDLFVCLEVARIKANHYGHDLKTEMAFLFVHGTLHLLGYDHEFENDKIEMFELQDKILKENGFNYEVIYDELDYLGDENDTKN